MNSTDYEKCSSFLSEALKCIDPKENLRSAMFYTRLFELVDDCKYLNSQK